MHVLSVNWKWADEKFRSGIEVWDEKSEQRRFIELRAGEKIGWIISGPRRCIGFIDSNGEYTYCPDRALVTQGHQCAPCSAMDFFNPCMRCTGDTCFATPKRWNICRQTEYVVYLVTFGDSVLKVGVSTKGRVLTRWVEQGADFGAVVANVTGGKMARRIEHKLSMLDGVTKQVRNNLKAELLFQQTDRKTAENLMQRFVARAGASYHLSMDKIISLSQYYELANIQNAPHALLRLGKNTTTLQVVGEIMGMKGNLLITRAGGSYLIVDLANIVGNRIENREDLTIVTQSSLSEFL